MSTKRESQRIAIVDLLASAQAVTEAEAIQVRGGIAPRKSYAPDDGGCIPLPVLPWPYPLPSPKPFKVPPFFEPKPFRL